MNNVYIALLHYPVYNKKGDIVTTAVTNMDIHDISRVAKTYGVKRFYLITPLEQQQEFVRRILYHWQEGYGVSYNPWRKEALDITTLKSTLDDAVQDIEEESASKVTLVATGASSRDRVLRFDDLRKKITGQKDAYLLIFGTGWGIADDIVDLADFCIESIRGPSSYNHLSVRSAVSIVLDRLLGIR
jgi:hypothetical protein